MVQIVKILTRKIGLVAAVMLILASAGMLTAMTPDDFAGLDSRGIASKIAAEGRPANVAQNAESVRNTVSKYARDAAGRYIDWFSDETVVSFSELAMLRIVPEAWFDKQAADFQQAMYDLNNIVSANSSVELARGEFPPGTVSEADYDNGFWRAGTGSVDGMPTSFYEPADCYKGDFARIYMYMAAVYPQQLWHGRAAMLFADGGFPLLTVYGRQVLLRWHRQDPVDDAERRRNDAISEAQGCGNLFVEIPELAEYIWGAHSGESFQPPTEPENPNPDEPDPDKPDPDNPDPETPDEPEPILLKAVYSKSRDGRIDFRSPYIAADSQWSIDGKTVDGKSVALDDISIGRHELKYSSRQARGKIIIKVEP